MTHVQTGPVSEATHNPARKLVVVQHDRSGKAQLKAIPDLETIQKRGERVLLTPLLSAEGQGVKTYPTRIKPINGVPHYSHIDLPSGKRRWIQVTKEHVGNCDTWTVSPKDAVYLEQQMAKRKRYMTILEVNQRIYDALDEETRKRAGVLDRDGRCISKGFFNSRFVDKPNGLKYFKYSYISQLGESGSGLPMFRIGCEDVLAIRYRHDYLVPLADGEKIIKHEILRLTRFWSVANLARKLGVTRRSIHNWIAERRFRAIFCGKETYVPVSDAAELLEEKKARDRQHPETLIHVLDVLRTIHLSERTFQNQTDLRSDKSGGMFHANLAGSSSAKPVRQDIPVYKLFNRRPCFGLDDAVNLVSARLGIAVDAARELLKGREINSPKQETPQTVEVQQGTGQASEKPEEGKSAEAGKPPVQTPIPYGFISLDSIPNAKELLMPHIDGHFKAIRITESMHNECGRVIFEDRGYLGIRFKKLEDGRIILSKSAAEVAKFYVALMAGPREGSPELKEMALGILGKVRLKKPLENTEIAILFVARARYMTLTRMKEAEYLGGLFMEDGFGGGKSNGTILYDKVFSKAQNERFKDGALVWLPARLLEKEEIRGPNFWPGM